MSEFAPKHTNKETYHSPEAAREQLEAIRKGLENKVEKAPDALNRQELSRRAEQQAVSGKELSHAEHTENKHHPVLVNKQLKEIAYNRTMTRVRKQLSAPSRAFSQLVHSKALDRPSEIASKTIARPSSMLGGALTAALGTSTLLWLTNHYGYEYNYLVVIALFAIGMFVGLFVELAWKTARRQR